MSDQRTDNFLAERTRLEGVRQQAHADAFAARDEAVVAANADHAEHRATLAAAFEKSRGTKAEPAARLALESFPVGCNTRPLDDALDRIIAAADAEFNQATAALAVALATARDN